MREIYTGTEKMKRVSILERSEGGYIVMSPRIPEGYVFPKPRPDREKSILSREITFPNTGFVHKFPQMDKETIQMTLSLLEKNRHIFSRGIEQRHGTWYLPAEIPAQVRAIFSKILQHEATVNPNLNTYRCILDIRCPTREEFLQAQENAIDAVHRDSPGLRASSYFVSFRFPSLLFTGTMKFSWRDKMRSFIDPYYLHRSVQENVEAAQRGEKSSADVSQLIPGTLVRFEGDGDQAWHAIPFLDLSDVELREHLEKHWPSGEHRLFVRAIFQPRGNP